MSGAKVIAQELDDEKRALAQRPFMLPNGQLDQAKQAAALKAVEDAARK